MSNAKFLSALALAGSTHSLADVERAIALGAAQRWQANGSTLVTEVQHYPQARALNLWLGAGKIGDLRVLAEEAYIWGRSHGCDRATLVGRDAWLRVLRGDGWRKLGSVLVKQPL